MILAHPVHIRVRIARPGSIPSDSQWIFRAFQLVPPDEGTRCEATEEGRRREGAKRGSARGCIEIETRCTPGALRETGPRRELVAMQCRYELHPRFISPHTATFPLPLPSRVKPRVKMYCLNKYKMSQCKNCVLKNKFFLIKEEN